MGKPPLKILLPLILAQAFVAPLAAAEWVRLNPLTSVSSDGATAIVVVPPGTTPSGFLITQGAGAMAQQFDPTTASGQAVFIEYNQNSRPERLVIGAKNYSIQGSFGLKIGTTRIAVDLTLQPYLTVVSEAKGASMPEPALAAFLGVDNVVLTTGQQAVALLEANQLQLSTAGARKTVFTYELNQHGELTLAGEPMATSRIGVFTEPPQNPCMSKSGHGDIIDSRDGSAHHLSEFLTLAVTSPTLSVLDTRSQLFGAIARGPSGKCTFTPLGNPVSQ